MKEKSNYAVLALLTILLLLPALYVGSYLALVERLDIGDSVPNYWVDYRWGRPWARPFFAPLHALDRQVRPTYWNSDE